MSVSTYLTLSETKDVIVSSFRQFKELGGPGKYVPLILWGEKGIGKTSAVKQASQTISQLVYKEDKKKGYRVVFNNMNIYSSDNLESLKESEILTIQLTILKLGAMQPFTINGYPQIVNKKVKSKSGKALEISTQTHAMPKFLVDSYDVDYHIIFVDEINRAHPDMHNAIMGFLDGDGINEHPIPENVFVIGAANPADENYGNVSDMEDDALINRGIHINVATSQKETLSYMFNDKSIDRTMYDFLNEDRNRIQEKEKFKSVTANENAGRFHSDRSQAQLGRFVPFLNKREQLMAVAKGLLGNTQGKLYVDRFGKSEVLFQPEDILNNMNKDMKKKIKECVNPKKIEDQRLDIVSKLNMSLILYFNQLQRPLLNKKTHKNLLTYLDLVPHDIKEELLTKAEFKDEEIELLGDLIVETTTEGSVKASDLEYR